MQLNVYIAAASDGHLLLRTVELPALTAEARKVEDIPETIRAAAAGLTGRSSHDFEILINY